MSCRSGAPVAFESAYGWGWLVELLEDYGYQPHLVHPLRCKAIASAKLKNDKVDAATLGQLLRADLLPEAWIAPPPTRQLRALLRHRGGAGAAAHLAAQPEPRGARRPAHGRPEGVWSGPGRDWLAGLDLPAAQRTAVDDCLAVIDFLAPRIDRLDVEVHEQAKTDRRVKVLTRLPGVGEFTAMVILAEIGDVARFPSARKLASWAGLTPTVRGSDLHVHHGHICKQGSAWLRWILIEAAQTAKRHPEFAGVYQQIAHRRGKKIATIAVARKLLTRAHHLLADAAPSSSPSRASTSRTHPTSGRASKPRVNSRKPMSRPARAR